MDVVAEAHLGMNDHVKAIQNSELRNSYYSDDQSLIKRNPHTEVAAVVTLLIDYRKGYEFCQIMFFVLFYSVENYF